MKITFDTTSNTVKYGRKTLNELDDNAKAYVINTIKDWADINAPLNDFEHDAMWMAYRYAIGRHTIASHAMAEDIYKYCFTRLSNNQKEATASDLRRELSDRFSYRNSVFDYDMFELFHVPTARNYTIIDCICDFLVDNNITTYDEFAKYSKITFFLDENKEIRSSYELCKDPEKIEKQKKDAELFFSMFEDFFIWNTLAHLFDEKAHHKSVLIDGTEEEWVWGWRRVWSEKEPLTFRKVRMPVDMGNLTMSVFLPDESIDHDIY